MRYPIGSLVKFVSNSPVSHPGTLRVLEHDKRVYLVQQLDGDLKWHCEEHFLEPALPHIVHPEWPPGSPGVVGDFSQIQSDPVSHPQHYMQHPSGLEIIDITRHHSYCIGNALKYLFRHEHKGNPVQDLRKAIAYIEFAIEDLEKGSA